MKRALYPGSFDPITNGHLNLIQRGVQAFGNLCVIVARNVQKKYLFSVQERVDMIREAVRLFPNVEVDSFDGLLVDFAAKHGGDIVLRGMRAVSDFEHEFQMVLMNRRMRPELETVFMMTGEEYFYVSSQLVREVASFGGSVRGLVPSHVENALRHKLASKGG